MIDISGLTEVNVSVLDPILRDTNIIGANVIGISSGPYGTIVHLADAATAAQQNRALKSIEGWGSLNVSLDKNAMVVGDADPVATASIADSDFVYVVLKDGQLYASGNDVTSGGTATVTLTDPEEGTYEVFMSRTGGNFANGSDTIVVSES